MGYMGWVPLVDNRVAGCKVVDKVVSKMAVYYSAYHQPSFSGMRVSIPRKSSPG
jgi:hypothetical protein